MPKPRIELAACSLRSNRANNCATVTSSCYSLKALCPQVALRQSSPTVVSPATLVTAVQPCVASPSKRLTAVQL